MRTLKEGGQVNAQGTKMRNMWVYAEDHKTIKVMMAQAGEPSLAVTVHRILLEFKQREEK